MGGYHVVLSVSYTLNNKSKQNCKISIKTKFSGTDAIGDTDTNAQTTPFANEQEWCITQYNSAVDALRQTEVKTGQSTNVERIYDKGKDDSTGSATTSPQATRVQIDGTPDNNKKIDPPTSAPIQTVPVQSTAPSTAPTNADIQASKTYYDVASYNKGTKLLGKSINKDYDGWILTATKITKAKDDSGKETVTIEWEATAKDQDSQKITSTHTEPQ